MLSLADAWHWVQIGFCASLGASVFAIGVASAFRGSGSGSRQEEYPEPHRSKCCPNDFEEVP